MMMTLNRRICLLYTSNAVFTVTPRHTATGIHASNFYSIGSRVDIPALYNRGPAISSRQGISSIGVFAVGKGGVTNFQRAFIFVERDIVIEDFRLFGRGDVAAIVRSRCV